MKCSSVSHYGNNTKKHVVQSLVLLHYWRSDILDNLVHVQLNFKAKSPIGVVKCWCVLYVTEAHPPSFSLVRFCPGSYIFVHYSLSIPYSLESIWYRSLAPNGLSWSETQKTNTMYNIVISENNWCACIIKIMIDCPQHSYCADGQLHLSKWPFVDGKMDGWAGWCWMLLMSIVILASYALGRNRRVSVTGSAIKGAHK
jgi:hypothetical protein